VTKKEIVKIIAERSNLPQLKTKQIVQWTFDAIVETLITEKRIELRNFGVFEVKRRKARKARNPRTDEQVFVGPKNVVTFQPGKTMEEKVRLMPLVEEKVRKPRRNRMPQPAGAEQIARPTDDATESSSQPVPSGMSTEPAGPHLGVTNGLDDPRKKRPKKEA
jgi:integration host factor subunit beta